MIVLVDYASPSVFESTREEASLEFAANARRPVRFVGAVQEHGFILRIALRALGEAIWSNDTWVEQSDILDPVITVHPDRLFLEAFSQDQSVYACLIVDPAVFATEGDGRYRHDEHRFHRLAVGALGELRTSRRTTFRVGAAGLEVSTAGAGGRFEKKVDLPDAWVRGFLQVQAAMGMPGTRITVPPIDLLSAIRFLRYTKARVSPRALRYEFEPGQDVRLVLEPWEHVVPLVGAEHSYTEQKTTRVWGRRRLKLIEGLLPFAEAVDIYLKGRAAAELLRRETAGDDVRAGPDRLRFQRFHRHRRLRSAGGGRRVRGPALGPNAGIAPPGVSPVDPGSGRRVGDRRAGGLPGAGAAVPAGAVHVRRRDPPLSPPRTVRAADRRGPVLPARPAPGTGGEVPGSRDGPGPVVRRRGDHENAASQDAGGTRDAAGHLSRLARGGCRRRDSSRWRSW